MEIKQKATGLHTVDKKWKAGRKRLSPGHSDYVLAIDVEKSVKNVDVTEDSSTAIRHIRHKPQKKKPRDEERRQGRFRHG